MGGRKQNGVLKAVIFIALEVVSLLLLRSSGSRQKIWLNRAADRTLGILWSGGENIRSYFRLRESNRALAEENMRLAAELRELRSRELSRNADVYDSLSAHYRYTPATIVKMSRNSQRNYIILDKGRADGIKPRSGIIASNGVVGIIDAVDERFSYGITLQNALVSVSARIGHTGAVAPLVWNGKKSNGGLLKNLPAHIEVAPGDTVLTSGFSGIFPPDIPLGITSGSRIVDGSVKEVGVELFLDFAALRYVAVVENTDNDAIGGAGL